MAYLSMVKGLSVDNMNNLQLLEILEAIFQLEEASGNLFKKEIQNMKNKLEELKNV